MLLLAFATTFVAVGLLILSIWQQLLGKRRAGEILRVRDPSQQRATMVAGPNLAQRWELAARQAGLDWTARSYLMIVGVGLAIGLLFLVTGAGAISLVIAVATVGGPWVVVRHRQQRRASQFAQQLPAALTLAANTIRAGGTMLQAVKAITKQMDDPLRGEFARVEQALHLQVPLAVALEQARQRIGAEEFAAVVVAFKVAGQAGADLDHVLENIAKEIVEEKQFRDAMRAASSEGRASARIVTAIPFLAGAGFLWMNPNYFAPMLSAGSGKALLIGCVLSIGVGWISINRITDTRNW